MYQALYRKWRPQTFDEVVGQPHVTQTLKKQLTTDRLSHAYLFIGTRGTGKTSCAKILAKAVNCENPHDGNPCNECPSCVGIDNGSILDVEELDAASNNGVDNVRSLRDEAVYTPAAVKKRVYIIDEVHMLSTSAFNALLKILEEPPSHLMFILATTESHKVPATILSRCQRYSFKRVSAKDIAGRVKTVSEAEGFEITDDAADLLARLADGSMRDALSLLDQCTYKSPIDSELVLSVAGLAGVLKTAELFGYICDGNSGEALRILDEMYYSGKDVGALINEIGTLIRDLLIVKIAPKNASSLLSGAYDGATLKGFSETGADRLASYMSIVNEAISDMSRSTDRKLTAELCVISMSAPSYSYRPQAVQVPVNTAPIQTAPIPSPAGERRAPESQAVTREVPIPPIQAQTAEPIAPAPKVEDVPEDISDTGPNFAEPENREEDTSEAQGFAQGMVQGDDVWNSILSILKSKLDMAAYSVLSDSNQMTAKVGDGLLGLTFGNEFTKGFVTSKETMAEIKAAAESVMGGAVNVKVLTDDGSKSKTADKLDKLSKFDNFNFK